MFLENQTSVEDKNVLIDIKQMENPVTPRCSPRVTFADQQGSSLKPNLKNSIKGFLIDYTEEEKSHTSLLDHIKNHFGESILNNETNETSIPNGYSKIGLIPKTTTDKTLNGFQNKFVENLLSNKIKINAVPCNLEKKSDEKPNNLNNEMYTNSFFNHPTVQDELFNENLKAKMLMHKYFNTNEDSSTEPLLNTEVEAKALNLIRHVSSMLKKFNSETESDEKLKPKPYDSLINKEYKALPNPSSSIRYIKPFMYPKNVNESVTEVHLSDFNLNNKIEDSSECFQFLDTKFIHSGNKILYKNKSENLNKDVSTDNIEDLPACVIPERYMSLRNMYSYFNMQNFSRLTSQKTLFNNSSHFGVRLNTKLEINVNDSDYKKWLKQNNFIKYTDLSITSDSCSIITDEIINCSVSERGNKKISPIKKTGPLKINTNSQTSCYFNFEQYYELILYEHIVVLNAVQFFTYLFHVQRLKQMTLPERCIQALFFVFCYYVTAFVSELGIDRMVENLDIESLIIKH